MSAETHNRSCNTKRALVDEFGRHLRGEATLRVVDFGAVPTLFLGVVFQSREKHHLVAGHLAQVFVGVLVSRRLLPSACLSFSIQKIWPL